ncbi:MAG: hypothetical protein NZT61_07090 [Deltaproteobacteria bacterium]|nr:hypothetical protein [Deltaproteobacteria bacterium]MCX7952736.1 hypothetical protein [Deltaproteobacteria bacterium]
MTRIKKIDLILATISFAIKLVLAGSVKPALISDSWEYACYARNLASNGDYKCLYQGDNPIYHNREFLFYRPPGYPLIISAAMNLFNDQWDKTLQVIQVFFESVALMVGLLFLSKLISKLALFLFSTMFYFWSPLVLTESLTSSFVFISALLSLRKKTLASVFFFMAVCMRNTVLFLFPIVLSSRRIFFVFLILLLPYQLYWSIRNFQLCNTFTSRTTNFYRHLGSDLGVNLKEIIKGVENKKCWEFAFDKKIGEKVSSFFLKNPKQVFGIYFKRLGNFFTFRLPFETEYTLMKFSLKNDLLRDITTVFFQITYGFVLISIPFYLLLLVTKDNKLCKLVLTVIFFLVLHPLVSPSNLRFITPIVLISIFVNCLLLEKLLLKLAK